MTSLDWTVLIGTIAFIVGYGVWRTRSTKHTADSYLRGGSDLKWTTIGLSIMATQASAITFLSTPGQAYEDGMRFVQFYFGLPIAMIVLSVAVVPRYYKLKVYTAYEFLESRFDKKTRQLAALLFLIQRGLAAGITIYAPAIILAQLLGWPLQWTNLAIGTVVTAYTVSGGTKAVSQTQKQQMIVMMLGMVLALVLVILHLPNEMSVGEAVRVAGAMGRMNPIDFSFDLDTRYTFWSGITGGFFLAMAYFGTDQSQVQRYLTGKSITESRLGLVFNGILKIPMQFLILFVGLMVFVFYQVEQPPAFFNQVALNRAHATASAPKLEQLESLHTEVHAEKEQEIQRYVTALRAGDAQAEAASKTRLQDLHARAQSVRTDVKAEIKRALPQAETKDADYIFLRFVMDHMPAGLVGLLLAVILSAAMSSTAGELNALGATMTVDFYKRSWRPNATDAQTVRASRWFTVFWGALAVGFATFASLIDNLIQAVNILGSLFYGATLGIFLLAFFSKRLTGTAVFVAGLISEALVITLFFTSDIGFLWYNVIGCGLVAILAPALQWVLPARKVTA